MTSLVVGFSWQRSENCSNQEYSSPILAWILVDSWTAMQCHQRFPDNIYFVDFELALIIVVLRPVVRKNRNRQGLTDIATRTKGSKEAHLKILDFINPSNTVPYRNQIKSRTVKIAHSSEEHFIHLL